MGNYVQPGTRLAALVPLDSVYVEANFKETQLARMKAGQKVDVEVDALPGPHAQGPVQSFAPASGSIFSLLPPENATGNFTKIVQRVPVRIAVPAERSPGRAAARACPSSPMSATKPTANGPSGRGGRAASQPPSRCGAAPDCRSPRSREHRRHSA